MAIPKEAWGWWAEEDGYRLNVRRDERGRVVFIVIEEGQPPEVAITLAPHRVRQLKDWLAGENVS